MATAAYAVLDPETGDVAVRQRRPPAADRRSAAARARVIDAEPGAAAGRRSRTASIAPSASCRSRAGEMLVLYTDGLIERPGLPA